MNFPDTRWTLISQIADPANGSSALDQICEVYWGPVYAWFVRSGHSHAEAQDLSQDFLVMVLRQRLLERADPVAGRLRSWILAALRHFSANLRRNDLRQKRGSGQAVLSVDHEDVAPQMQAIAADCLSPDEAFDRAWVEVLLRRVLEVLSEQYRLADRAAEFALLLPWLVDDPALPQAAAAAQAKMTVANFRVKIHRLRARYRETLRREIASTLDCEEDYTEELGYLFRITGRQI